MKKIDLGQTITILANVGVIAGIIFLAFEIRQNTVALSSGSIQGISDQSYEATALLVQEPELRAAIYASCGSEPLTADQRFMITAYVNAVLRVQLNRFYQSQIGILDEEMAVGLGGRGGIYRQPIFREAWERLGPAFPADFRGFVEREILPMSQEDCAGIF